jgi:hypothetical protein
LLILMTIALLLSVMRPIRFIKEHTTVGIAFISKLVIKIKDGLESTAGESMIELQLFILKETRSAFFG